MFKDKQFSIVIDYLSFLIIIIFIIMLSVYLCFHNDFWLLQFNTTIIKWKLIIVINTEQQFRLWMLPQSNWINLPKVMIDFNQFPLMINYYYLELTILSVFVIWNWKIIKFSVNYFRFHFNLIFMTIVHHHLIDSINSFHLKIRWSFD